MFIFFVSVTNSTKVSNFSYISGLCFFKFITLKVFESVGFKIVEKNKWKKFNNEVEGVTVKIDL